MRLALVVLLTASCASPEEGRSSLAPTEFHLFGSHSWDDREGSIDGRHGYGWNTAGSSEGNSIGAGLTWDIGAPASSPAMLLLLREMQRRHALEASPSIVVVTEPLDHAHEPGQGPSGPIPVVVEGAKPPIWVPLIAALSLLATAVASYLGRDRIPIVRRYTARGRATRGADDLEDEDAPEA